MTPQLTLSFGKYAGRNLWTDVPDYYLCWLLDNIRDLGPTMTEAIRTRLGLSAQPPKRDTKPLSLNDDLENRILRRFERLLIHQCGKDNPTVTTAVGILESVLRYANSKVDIT